MIAIYGDWFIAASATGWLLFGVTLESKRLESGCSTRLLASCWPCFSFVVIYIGELVISGLGDC
jgi:hypothetical protein